MIRFTQTDDDGPTQLLQHTQTFANLQNPVRNTAAKVLPQGDVFADIQQLTASQTTRNERQNTYSNQYFPAQRERRNSGQREQQNAQLENEMDRLQQRFEQAFSFGNNSNNSNSNSSNNNKNNNNKNNTEQLVRQKNHTVWEPQSNHVKCPFCAQSYPKSMIDEHAYQHLEEAFETERLVSCVVCYKRVRKSEMAEHLQKDHTMRDQGNYPWEALQRQPYQPRFNIGGRAQLNRAYNQAQQEEENKQEERKSDTSLFERLPQHYYSAGKKQHAQQQSSKEQTGTAQQTTGGSGNDKDEDAQTQCMICWVDYKNGDLLVTLPCKHVAHAQCMRPWVNDKGTCPLHRVSIQSLFNRNSRN